MFEAGSRYGATMAVARQLVEAGCPDQPWEAGRPGKRDLIGPSLHRLARLTVVENGDVGPRGGNGDRPVRSSVRVACRMAPMGVGRRR
jgi:hypothetical protein